MSIEEFVCQWFSDSPVLSVTTSGSTGTPKVMQVEKCRMRASARKTCDFLGLQPEDTALLCLSTDYIAGKMMVVRALERNLKMLSVAPSGHPLAAANDLFPGQCIDFCAMVPLQVYNSLRVPAERERLMQIRNLIIGGGAIDDQMERELRDFPHAVYSTYGMTETLSHIAMRCISGPAASSCYSPLDGVTLSLTEDGCLAILAPDVCAGLLVTNDRAELFPDGRFRILGRKDNVICSGGIKIQIEEVERRLRPYLSDDFLVTWQPDAKFGQRAVLLTLSVDSDAVMAVCREMLPPYFRPHHVYNVSALPLTPTGKPARSEAARMAASFLTIVNK